MTGQEFANLRRRFDKTQKEMAQLLGVSIKAVHSYEQGWRSVPDHVEKQLLLLTVSISPRRAGQKACWIINHCPEQVRRQCPAWQFDRGSLCWLINGTICNGRGHKTWKEKIRMCRSGPVLKTLLEGAPNLKLLKTEQVK